MIPNLASLSPSLEQAVTACAALVASLVSISICLWPRKDEPQIDEPASVRSKGDLP
jgi:hypothetical protein